MWHASFVSHNAHSAGVRGNIIDSLGTVSWISKKGTENKAHFFMIEVTEILEEWSEQVSNWGSIQGICN